MHSNPNVFVVGGGPAGLAASIELRGRGFTVTVADGAKPPVDKACGEGLMPETVASLRRLGISFDSNDGFPLRGIRFISAGVSVTANFSSGQGIGIRRTVLHSKMAAHAEEIGVQFMWDSPVTRISPGAVQVRDKSFLTDCIVGADGSGSRVRRWSGLEDPATSQSPRYAFRSHFGLAPWSEYVEVYWAEDAQAYVTPVANDEICVVVLSERSAMRNDVIASKFPDLAARLINARVLGAERGAVTRTHRLKRIYNDNVVLVGDASGAVDAITGEGLNLSFQHAIALADCLPSRNLSEYQKIHRRLELRPLVTGYLLSMLGRQRFLRKRTIGAFMNEPALFARFLDLHLGYASRAQAFSAAMRLGWHFAAS
jgi:2-polyprenyl-6-methoxyphenol hydroxylase-like FAD-dependent oxidoreductase